MITEFVPVKQVVDVLPIFYRSICINRSLLYNVTTTEAASEQPVEMREVQFPLRDKCLLDLQMFKYLLHWRILYLANRHFSNTKVTV